MSDRSAPAARRRTYPAESLPAVPGTYLLWLRADERFEVVAGRLGRLELPAGWYGYVGSAFGPGGLRARVGRHLDGTGKRHWHIDYLRAACRVGATWWCMAATRYEHAWAVALGGLRGAVAIDGFGASDCRCRTHLYRFARRPSPASFRACRESNETLNCTRVIC